MGKTLVKVHLQQLIIQLVIYKCLVEKITQ